MPFLTFNSPKKPASDYIEKMFDGMANRYTLFAKLIGFGDTSRLRKIALKDLKLAESVLDLGCGTGDMAIEAMKKVGPNGYVALLDFSKNMLTEAQNRIEKLPPNEKCAYHCYHTKAEMLPIDEKYFDWIISGFVLRNLYEQIEAIVEGIYKSLKPGGQIRLLDLTIPKNCFKRLVYGLYFNTLVALYGICLFGKKYPIAYLNDSAARFLDQEQFVTLLKSKGFTDIRVQSFFLSSVSIYSAKKH